MTDSPAPGPAVDSSRGGPAGGHRVSADPGALSRSGVSGGDDVCALSGPGLHGPGGAVDSEGTGASRKRRWGFVVAAFTLAYALFEIPDRAMGRPLRLAGSTDANRDLVVVLHGADRRGDGPVACFWSCDSCSGRAKRGRCRIQRGFCEHWFPESSRGRGAGVCHHGDDDRWSGRAGRLAMADRRRSVWRWSFAALRALVGLAWATCFLSSGFATIRPSIPATNDAERRLIAAGRSLQAIAMVRRCPYALDLTDASRVSCTARSPGPGRLPANVWLLGGAMMTMSGDLLHADFVVSEIFAAARGALARSIELAGQLGAGSGASGLFFGGWLTDWLVANDRQSALGPDGSGCRRCSDCWRWDSLPASAPTRPCWPSVFVALACFGVQIQVPAWWASATQVSGRHLGALFGMMNMLGAVGGIFSQIFFGRFADWMKGLGYTGRAQWDPAFTFMWSLRLIGMVLWSLINPEKTVEDTTRTPRLQAARAIAFRARSWRCPCRRGGRRTSRLRGPSRAGCPAAARSRPGGRP